MIPARLPRAIPLSLVLAAAAVAGAIAYDQFSLVQTIAGSTTSDLTYRITSDGNGPYLDDPRSSGKDNDFVDSYAERSYGNDILDLSHSLTRTLCLSFSGANQLQVLDSSLPLPASGCFRASLGTRSGGPGSTAVGQVTYDGFAVSWTDSVGRSYALGMGASYPGTDRARVTCTDVGTAGSPCNNWLIEPSGCATGHVNDPDGICVEGRSRVLVFAGKGRNAQWYPVADYQMPFAITAAR